ncbi:MAG: hypothetical protein ACO1RX_02515 [Candidatus Sericytochromatia bacterium]
MSGFTREIRGPFFTLGDSPGAQVYYVHQDNGFFRRHLLTQALKQYGSRQLSGKPVYTAGGVYGFQRSCIERFDVRTQLTSDFAGHCQEKGFKNGPVREARFDEILDMAPDGEGGLYISEQIPLRNGLRIRHLHDGVVETRFESAPIATAERLKGELFNYFSDLVCEGVCAPGSFTSQAPHEPFFKYYRWNPLPEYSIPYSFSLDEYELEAGDGNASEYFPAREIRHIQTLPILRDGPESLATSWDHAFLQADDADNVYFMNHLCGQAYIRRLDPQGRVTTLIRELDAGPEMSGQILHPEKRLKECASNSATTLFAVDGPRQQMFIWSAGLYVLNLNTQQLQKLADLDAPPFNLKLTVSQIGVGPTGDVYLLGEETAQPGLSHFYRVVTAAPALGKSGEDRYN